MEEIIKCGSCEQEKHLVVGGFCKDCLDELIDRFDNPTTSKYTVKSLRLSREVVDKVNILAKQQNRNFTNMVETILIQRFKP